MIDEKRNHPHIALFKYCPRCASPAIEPREHNGIYCEDCNLIYIFNPAIATGAFIRDDHGRLLLIRRAKDPGKGKFGIPGGFIDPWETAEQGLLREVKEEVNLDVTTMEYLCSHPNEYWYREIMYIVLDYFYLCEVRSLESLQALDEVDACCFLRPEEIDPEKIAFVSIRTALAMIVAQDTEQN